MTFVWWGWKWRKWINNGPRTLVRFNAGRRRFLRTSLKSFLTENQCAGKFASTRWSFFVGGLYALGLRENVGLWTRSFGLLYSDGGVRSSAKSLTADAPTRRSSRARTLTVRVMSPVCARMRSFGFTSREGLTGCPPMVTRPLRQAAAATVRVL